MTTTASSAQLTAGDKWHAKRAFPWKLLILALVAALAIGGGVWWVGFKPKPEVPVVVAEPEAHSLSAVEHAGVSELLRQFSTSAHTVNGEITDGSTGKARVSATVTADGRFGFGSLNAANIDAPTLLNEGVVYVRGSATFWTALRVSNGNFPGYVKVPEDFFKNRIFLPAGAVSAALAPNDTAKILGDEYTNSEGVATFGPTGLEKVSLDGYTVTVLPTDDAGVFGTAKPLIDSLDHPAELVWQGGTWSIAAPPAGAPAPENGGR